MPISTDTIVRVAHADIALDMAFSNSVDHWHSKNEKGRPWKVLPAHCDAILIGKEDCVAIDGDCSNGVSAPDGGLIHIYGDLASHLDADGHYEIVITGDVAANGTIEASGYCHVFVGGRFSGELRSSDSAKIWIDSDFNGTIKTGNPSTQVYVGRNYLGNIKPAETASLLWLTVAGFAAQESMSKIVDCGYTQFNASIAHADCTPGIYPINGRFRKAFGRNSYNRWCVQSGVGQ